MGIIHLTTPRPPRRGSFFFFPRSFFVCGRCPTCVICVTVPERHILSHQVKYRSITSHRLYQYDILYLVLFCFAAWLYTAWSYVVNGHTIPECTRSSVMVQRSRTVPRLSQAFHDVTCECQDCSRFFRQWRAGHTEAGTQVRCQ